MLPYHDKSKQHGSMLHHQTNHGMYVFIIVIIILGTVSVFLQPRSIRIPMPMYTYQGWHRSSDLRHTNISGSTVASTTENSSQIAITTEQHAWELFNHSLLKMADIVELFDANQELIPQFLHNNIAYQPSRNFLTIGPPIKDVFWPNIALRAKTHRWRILVWNRFSANLNYLSTHLIRRCPYSNCDVVTNRQLLNQSDVVIFNGRDKWSSPPSRSPKQRWVFFVLESPLHVDLDFARLTNVFNWTAGYRLDTDVNAKLGYTTNKSDICWSGNLPIRCAELDKSAQNSKQLQSSKIQQGSVYINELKKYIKIDFFGRCGSFKCPPGEPNCSETFMSRYKFYLAFENSNCRDYITEKFWYPLLSWHSIPVAMGGVDARDYIRVAPPNSFIHISQFSSAKDLAAYLTLLDRNDTLYLRYQKWREDYSVHRDVVGSFACNLCEKLNDGHSPVQTYRDFKGWYNQDICRN